MFRKYENTAGKRHDRQEDQKHRKNQCLYSGAFLYNKIADCKTVRILTASIIPS